MSRRAEAFAAIATGVAIFIVDIILETSYVLQTGTIPNVAGSSCITFISALLVARGIILLKQR